MEEVQKFNESKKRRKKAYGIDKAPENRPGVPMETKEPHKAEGAHWDEPRMQKPRNEKLKRAGMDRLTHVYGTAVPPRGVSGMIRRSAYKIPEHNTSHWALLMLGDRVDVLEGRISEHPLRSAVLAAGGLMILKAYFRKRRSRSLS